MEFTIDNNHFSKAISDVGKIVTTKTTLPILTGIKIEAKSDHLILLGSNSDILIKRIIPQTINGKKVLEVHSTGSVVVSAKYLSELVRKLPNNINLKMTNNHLVTIQSGEIITKLNGLDAEEYPNLPTINQNNKITLSSEKLIDIIKQTVFAVSKSEARPVLTGVNFSFKQNELICVATNSHRLALSKNKLENSITGSFIVPSSSLNELIKLFSSAQTMVEIYTTDNYILFKTDTVSLYSRLIEGNFPNISSLMSQVAKTVIFLDTRKLLEGIDRANLFASEWRNNNINLTIQDKKLKIASNSTEVGKIEETQRINEISGEEELNVTLDGSFLVDALKEIKEDEVTFSYNGTMRPVLIQPVGNTSQLHLISPVRSY